MLAIRWSPPAILDRLRTLHVHHIRGQLPAPRKAHVGLLQKPICASNQRNRNAMRGGQVFNSPKGSIFASLDSFALPCALRCCSSRVISNEVPTRRAFDILLSLGSGADLWWRPSL